MPGQPPCTPGAVTSLVGTPDTTSARGGTVGDAPGDAFVAHACSIQPSFGQECTYWPQQRASHSLHAELCLIQVSWNPPADGCPVSYYTYTWVDTSLSFGTLQGPAQTSQTSVTFSDWTAGDTYQINVNVSQVMGGARG